MSIGVGVESFMEVDWGVETLVYCLDWKNGLKFSELWEFLLIIMNYNRLDPHLNFFMNTPFDLSFNFLNSPFFFFSLSYDFIFVEKHILHLNVLLSYWNILPWIPSFA